MDSNQNPAQAAALRLAALTNPIIDADHVDYDDARHTFYHGLNRRPALIARPASDDEVAEVIAAARETGMQLAVRSGGHSAVGYGVWDDSLVLDLSAMKAIDIDLEQQTAWAETGLTAVEFTTATSEHGLVVGFGDTGSVGIGGITLGGGVGLLHRSQGLTLDSVLAADIVTADGRQLRLDETNYPDLFWAIRGGGGNFGVVTRFRYKLHPVNRVVGGMLAFPATPDVAEAVLAKAMMAPEELSGEVTMMTMPRLTDVEPRFYGQVMVGIIMVHSGSVEEGKQLFDEFRAISPPIIDTVQAMPYAAMLQGPEPPQPHFAADRTWFSDGIDTEAMGRIIDGFTGASAPLRVVQIRPLGGAVARVASDATAFAHRNRNLMVYVGAGYSSPDDRDRHEAWVDSIVNAVGGGESAYVGFMSDADEAQVRAAYPGDIWDRLRVIKSRYDPENLFRLNHNIPPEAE